MAAKVGPFGAAGAGVSEDIDPTPVGLKVIDVWSTDSPGGRISAISFTYKDSSNRYTKTSEWGTTDGFKHNRVPVPSNVHVSRLSGTFDNMGITSLTFYTSDGAQKGPYGDPAKGTAFDIPVTSSAIVGFFGSSGDNLVAVGAYVVPLN